MKFEVENIVSYYNSNVSWKSLIIKPYKKTIYTLSFLSISITLLFQILFMIYDNNWFIWLMVLVLISCILSVKYCIYLSLREYGNYIFFDFFKVYKKDEFKKYQRKTLKKYLKNNNLYKDKTLKQLIKSINFDNKYPTFDLSYISLILSTFIIPLIIKGEEMYLNNFNKSTIQNVVDLIKISLFSTGISVVLLQFRQLVIINKMGKYNSLRLLTMLIEDIRLEKTNK